MTRCQHCNKLTHNEHLNVYFDPSEIDKVYELRDLTSWITKWEYHETEIEDCPHGEYGKLKCGDIWIHFIVKRED